MKIGLRRRISALHDDSLLNLTGNNGGDIVPSSHVGDTAFAIVVKPPYTEFIERESRLVSQNKRNKKRRYNTSFFINE